MISSRHSGRQAGVVRRRKALATPTSRPPIRLVVPRCPAEWSGTPDSATRPATSATTHPKPAPRGTPPKTRESRSYRSYVVRGEPVRRDCALQRAGDAYTARGDLGRHHQPEWAVTGGMPSPLAERVYRLGMSATIRWRCRGGHDLESTSLVSAKLELARTSCWTTTARWPSTVCALPGLWRRRSASWREASTST